MKIWIVGDFTNAHSEFVAVFKLKANALKACKTPDHFLLPADMGRPINLNLAFYPKTGKKVWDKAT